MKMLARGCHDNFTKNLQVSHVEVNDKVLGIIGAGNIGREVIKIAQAMDMKILAHTQTFPGGRRRRSLRGSSNASPGKRLCLPSLSPNSGDETPDQPGDPVHDEAYGFPYQYFPGGPGGESQGADRGLKDRSDRRSRAGCAGNGAPLPENPLYTMDNVILTPHMGWKGLETRKRLVSILAGNIEAYFQGMPVNVVS